MGKHKKEDETILIEEEKPFKKKINKAICNVINKTPSKTFIDFNGFGIMLLDSNSNKTDRVEIQYVGEFNTPSFSITSHKYL
jgi:hypothetical protein